MTETMPTNTYGFFVVWRPDSGPPRKRHATLAEAQTEAERLARSEPARSFYVLSAVSVSRGVPVEPTPACVVTVPTHYSAAAMQPKETVF